MEYLSSIVFHTVIVNMLFERGKNQELWLRYYIQDKFGVCIIESIPHCHTKMLWKAVWNTIDDTYFNFVLYIVTKPHFRIFASFESLFGMTVWNTIDDTYSIVPLYRNEATFLDLAPFVFYIETKPHFLIFVSLESIICMTVWDTIDNKFSIIPLYRNEATFLNFASFKSFFSMTVWNTIDD